MNIEGREIDRIFAEKIEDSRGNPTIKVTVWAGEASGSFSVPSGASTGSGEARELRDADGKGVESALEQINSKIAPALVGQNVLNQGEIDRLLISLDGTSDKSMLGGNSMIGVSIACAKAGAKVLDLEVWEYLQTLAEMRPSRSMPYLYMNLVNGGKHADNDLAFQEYHVVPETGDPALAIEMGKKIHHALEYILRTELGRSSLSMGDEGGFAPKLSDIRQPLLYLEQAIRESGHEGQVRLALDVASSSFYEDGKYRVNGQEISKQELLEIYNSLIKEFNLLSIEDPFEEEDFSGFQELKNANKGIYIVGDDLTVTNEIRLARGIKEDSLNAMIIKPNQIGTLSETLETMKLARENNVELIVSHRSGETDDDFIADLAFAFKCFGIKAGAPTKPERMVKYTRLINISQHYKQ